MNPENLSNSKAWKMLLEEEQLALTLQLGNDMSTWQAGEVMGKAHYKYLEIYKRANNFLKLHHNHLELYNTVIPKFLPIPKPIRKYFKMLIKHRKSMSETVRCLTGTKYRDKATREQELINIMTKLYQSKDLVEHNFAVYIREFDRWNNFRILPPPVQEISGFPRREKNNYKKVLKQTSEIHELVLRKLIERFHDEDHKLYAIIFSSSKKNIKFMRVKDSPEIINELSMIGLFIFTDMDKALSFRELVVNFRINEFKHCKQGQEFWPKFREAISGCINSNMIQKAIPSTRFKDFK